MMSDGEGIPSAQEGRRRNGWFLQAATLFLLLALGYLTISGNVSAPLSSYDDELQVAQEENPLLRLDQPWYRVFTEFHYAQYVPVTLLSFRWNYGLFGPHAPWSFRVGNWLIHAASALVLLRILRRSGLSRFEALFVAAAWTAHPLACESVAWITERSNCLAFLFGALGFAAYLRWFGSWKGSVGGAAGFLLALLSKPGALGWFPVFVAVEILGGPEGLDRPASPSPDRPAARRALASTLRLLPLAVLAALFALLGIWREGLGLQSPPGGHWYTALMTDAEIFVRYLGNVLAPVRLSAFYAVRDITSWTDGRLYAHAALLAAAVGGSLWAARSRRRALFGWLWFFGGLAPNWNLVSIAYLMQDRYVYIASAGVLLVLVETAAGLAARLEDRRPVALPAALRGKVLAALALLYVAGLGVLCAARSVTWGDVAGDCPLGLFAQAAERQPDSGLARTFYGITLARAAQELRAQPKPEVERARELSVRAVRQLILAQDCPDVYRFFAPQQARVVLAHEALWTGQIDLARSTLAGHLPPAAPGGDATYQLSPADIAGGYRTLEENGVLYRYEQDDVAGGCLLMALCEAADFKRQSALRRGEVPTAEVEAALARALQWVARARQFSPGNPEIPEVEQELRSLLRTGAPDASGDRAMPLSLPRGIEKGLRAP